MRWMLLAASAIVAASLWLPLEAAEPAAPSAGEDAITFEQYRDWRMHFIERRQTQLAMQLSGTNLPDRQKARLEQARAYYDWLAGLSEADRDRRFRERFDQIDANHDRSIRPSVPPGGRSSGCSTAAMRARGVSRPNRSISAGGPVVAADSLQMQQKPADAAKQD